MASRENITMENVVELAETTHSAWLTTTGSQIFFMELGFLCYESGYIAKEFNQSVMIKNMMDIFFGFTTYIIFGYALSVHNYEYIALFNLDLSECDTVFVHAAFAATAATIMSGAVLERMKNIAYTIWVFFIVVVNYSAISYWTWDKNGFLNKLGFIDGAGDASVHMVGGMAGLIAVIYLGPRYSSLLRINDQSGKILKPKHPPTNLLVMMIGLLILWYGWIAFNTSSHLISDINISSFYDNSGLPATLTIVLPSCSSCSIYFATYIRWPNWEWLKKRGIIPYSPLIERSAENLATAILSGLVVVTGCCYSINIVSAIFIGFFVPFPIFIISYYLRKKLQIDDPLDVIPIHLFGGIMGLFFEGLFNVHDGLLTTFTLKHFGVQCFGIISVFVFNLLTMFLYWNIILKFILFRNNDIKTSPLRVCLFTRNNTREMNYSLAFRELMFGDTAFSRVMMLKYHKYLCSVYCIEQLDFIIAVHEYRKLFDNNNSKVTRQHAFNSIVELYFKHDSAKEINTSHEVRTVLISLYNKEKEVSLYQADDNMDVDNMNDNLDIIIDDNADNTVLPSVYNDIEIDKTVFNEAFMETLRHIYTNLKIFLQKYQNNYYENSLINFKDFHYKQIYKVTNKFYVEWWDPNNIQNDTDTDTDIRIEQTQKNDDTNNDNDTTNATATAKSGTELQSISIPDHEPPLSSVKSKSVTTSTKNKILRNVYVKSHDGRMQSMEDRITEILR